MTMLFRPAEVSSAFLKMALIGFQGSGKTYTAADTAIGLVHYARKLQVASADKPAFFLDTEKGSDWVKPRIEAAGIALHTAKTRAFVDLLTAIQEAEKNASVLMIDSLTHFWQELCSAYCDAKAAEYNRPTYRLQFQDWAFLKGQWRRFTDLFVNSNLHVILCGRAGYEYDMVEDDDTKKKQLEKTGIKMKAEGEMGYEPDLLVLMERRMDMDTKKDQHVAHVLKDRSTLIDGHECIDPGFAFFLPHIQCLNIGGRHMGLDTSHTSAALIPATPRENRGTQRKIVLAEIEDLLTTHYPSTSGKDRQAKIISLREHFDASWAEIEEVMPLERLRQGYDAMHIKLNGKPSRYSTLQTRAEAVAINDSLPDHSAPPVDAAAIPGFLDRREKKPNGSHEPAGTDANWINEFVTH